MNDFSGAVMNLAGWAIPVVLLALCVMFTTANWQTIFSGPSSAGTTPSITPFVGGVSGAVGVILLPVAGSWKYAWIPLLCDYGCFLYTALFLYCWLTEPKSGAEDSDNPAEAELPSVQKDGNETKEGTMND